ncbi:MAG: DUF1553 domain-containing protein, partial [Planctomycetota bacterium]
DMQRIHRRIVLSETYCQSVHHPRHDDGITIDPRNLTHWHRGVRRLDAEQFRDSILAANGELDFSIGGPSFEGNSPRRTVYMKRLRNTGDEMLRMLDTPTGIVGTAIRDVTITPTQTLLLMNNDRIMTIAEKLAARVERDLADQTRPGDHDFGVTYVRHLHYLLTFSHIDDDLAVEMGAVVSASPTGAVDVAHVLLNANAFLFIE